MIDERASISMSWIITDDLPAMLEIEGESFEKPWDEQDFRSVLRQRNMIGKALRIDNMLVGYTIYELLPAALKIANIAVHPSFRGLGLGGLMILDLKKKLSIQRRRRILANVSERNLSAHLFFRSQGFHAFKVLAGYYEQEGLDAYAFRYSVAESDGPFCPINRIENWGVV